MKDNNIILSIVKNFMSCDNDNDHDDDRQGYSTNIFSNIKNELHIENKPLTILIVFDSSLNIITIHDDKKWYKKLNSTCKNTISQTTKLNVMIAFQCHDKCMHNKKVINISKHLKKYLPNVDLVKTIYYKDYSSICKNITNSNILFNYIVTSDNFYKYCSDNITTNTTYDNKSDQDHKIIAKLNNIKENEIIIQSLFPKKSFVSTLINTYSVISTFSEIQNKATTLKNYDSNLPCYLNIINKRLIL